LETKRFCSIFSQLLQLFPRLEFEKAVKDTKAERHARGFRCWDQFVAMMFCQLGQANSLREICGGLASCLGRLVHLGAQEPKKSTLAYANEHRPWKLYETVFYQLLDKCRGLAGPRTKFRFKNPLMSIDGTCIDLCTTLYPWAEYQRKKGAVKLHFMLDHAGYLPTLMVLTTLKISELRVARRWKFDPGTIVTFDRGYVDFEWFQKLNAAKVYFVTRLKRKARYELLEERPAAIDRGILSDHVVRFTAPRTQRRYPDKLRIVTIRTDDGEILEFLTNNLVLAASTIAAIYKDRWQIELFFKALKQNLRIKTFVGTSANALHIQIWTALIAVLILKYLKMKAQFGWSLSNLAALLRMNLFVYRDLWAWLNEPFTPPPLNEEAQLQGALNFG
jgi:Transposase DDE domain/Domain of unknown function (DUF4372)